MNIATLVLERARTHPDSPAMHHPVGRSGGRVRYETLSNRQLDQQSDAAARDLLRAGVKRSMRVAVMVRPDQHFFCIMLALLKIGAVPVLVDPGIGLKKLGHCLREAAPGGFIGIPLAHAARVIFGWGRATVRVLVTAGRLAFPGTHRLQTTGSSTQARLEVADVNDDDDAAILFTSGSTGPPKGALYTHGNFCAQVAAIRQLAGNDDDEVDVPTFPPFALFDPALGMTAAVPDMDPRRPGSVDPRRIFDAVDTFGATNLFGSPALLDTVGRYGVEHGVAFKTLRRVVTAGAPVSATIMRRFSKLLSEDATIFTPYGATECLPVSCISSHEILRETQKKTDRGAGVCVGSPVPSVRVAIMPITDGPVPDFEPSNSLPPMEIGEIAVCGPQATASYVGRPGHTVLAKMRDAEGRLWHRMGDVGYRDESGRLWFCGRKTHRVRTKNGTLFTAPIEGIFNSHPSVRRSALVGVSSGQAERPVICIETEHNMKPAAREKLKGELLSLASDHKKTEGIRDVLFHPKFPVDIRHNAKIGRPELSRWAAKKLGLPVRARKVPVS